MKIIYARNCVTKKYLPIIIKAIPILREYADAGYRVTLRQLHYQFVARGIMPNTDKTYKAITEAMRQGRLEGLVDWDWIEDRTRKLRSWPRWSDPAHILDACAEQFHVDFWKNQRCRVEVWIEKDALLGVIEMTCKAWDCPFFSCRGYPSVSELHEAAKRIKRYNESGQSMKIIYCGDHDPSGLNMDSNLKRMLKDFGADFQFERIALNMEQIERFKPPANPVKETDSRAGKYCRLFGDKCWELDALSPQDLDSIVEQAIIECIDDMDDFEARRAEDEAGREQLGLVGENFDKALRYVKSYVGEEE